MAGPSKNGLEHDQGTVQGRAGSRRARRVVQGRKAKRKQFLTRIGVAVGGALVLVLILVLVNREDAGVYANRAIILPPALPAEVPREGRTLGNPGAPVHIVEYGDFQCPGCSAFARSVKPQIVQNHVATGEVLLEYRDLTGLGRESHEASVGAACALEQGRFWEFYDVLFYNQIGRDEGGFSSSRMTRMAEQLNLDAEAFGACLGTDRFNADLDDMRQRATSDGVQATPTLVINGVLLVAPNYEQVRQQIQVALGESGS